MAKSIKNYEYKGINYKIDGHRWLFEAPTFTLRHPCKGGNAVALRVAAQISGALKRTKNIGLDSLARSQIKAITGF